MERVLKSLTAFAFQAVLGGWFSLVRTWYAPAFTIMSKIVNPCPKLSKAAAWYALPRAQVSGFRDTLSRTIVSPSAQVWTDTDICPSRLTILDIWQALDASPRATLCPSSCVAGRKGPRATKIRGKWALGRLGRGARSSKSGPFWGYRRKLAVAGSKKSAEPPNAGRLRGVFAAGG